MESITERKNEGIKGQHRQSEGFVSGCFGAADPSDTTTRSYHKCDEDQAGGTRMLQEKPPQVRRRIRDNEEECAEEKTRGSLEYAPVDGARNILTFSEYTIAGLNLL